MNPTTTQHEQRKNDLVEITSNLFQILQSVGANTRILPLKKALDLLGFYICKQGLLTTLPDGRKLVTCKDDTLGSIFQVDQFYLADTLNFLKKCMFALQPRELGACDEVDGPIHRKSQSVDQVDGPKRKCESLEGEEGPPAKKAAVIDAKHILTLFIDEPKPYDPTPETPLSVQGYETENPKSDEDSEVSDHSQINWGNYQSGMFSEYEVESVEEDNISEDSIDSEDDIIEDIIGTIIICQDDSDKDFWADASSEEEDFSDDSEMEVERPLVKYSDKWECGKCGFLNHISLRYCDRCWQDRPHQGQLQLPPAWHRRKNKHLVSEAAMGGSECSSQDEGGSMVTANTKVEHLCQVCLEWPKTGIIVHGRTSHQVCCFRCASKLRRRGQPCPVCRRPIERVTRNFVA